MAPAPPPPIAPVPAGVQRPRWSVVIPVHNCADLLAPCLESVLAADPGSEAQILVLDDQSSDGPDEVVDRIADERVRYQRNEVRRGAIGNFNACLQAARGELVHLLHGDDLVNVDFYRLAERAFDTHADVGMFTGRVQYVDDAGLPHEVTRIEVAGSGVWVDALDVLTVSNRVRPPGVAVRRSCYEALGGFDPDLPHAADWEMWVRLAAHTDIWFEDEVVARYRRHGDSDTAVRELDGSNLSERLDCIAALVEHLPSERRVSQARRAYAYSAAFAVRSALRMGRAREFRGARHQMSGAITALGRMVRSPRP